MPSHPEFGGEEGSRFYAYILRFRTTRCTSQSAVRELRRSSCHCNGLRGTRVSPYPATSSNARLESVTPFEPAKPGRPPAIQPSQTEGASTFTSIVAAALTAAQRLQHGESKFLHAIPQRQLSFDKQPLAPSNCILDGSGARHPGSPMPTRAELHPRASNKPPESPIDRKR